MRKKGIAENVSKNVQGGIIDPEVVDFSKRLDQKGGRKVPFITIKMLEGRSHEVKRKLMEKITQAVTETLQVDADRVHIFLEDLKADHYARGGKLISENK